MNDDAKEPLTAGSGGGLGDDNDGNRSLACDSTFQISGTQVMLFSRKPLPLSPTPGPGPSRVTLLATGGLPTMQDEGTVDVRGAKGVRITAGGVAIPMLSPPVSDDGTNGVEVVVSEPQSITLQRGLSPLKQTIELAPNSITIDAGLTGTLTLKAGMSEIVLSPMGITIKGLLVEIN
jgi:hypothetical protein